MFQEPGWFSAGGLGIALLLWGTGAHLLGDGWACQWVLGVENTPQSVLLFYLAVDLVSEQCTAFNRLTHPSIPVVQGSTVKPLGVRGRSRLTETLKGIHGSREAFKSHSPLVS